jgi:hypothetical protein
MTVDLPPPPAIDPTAAMIARTDRIVVDLPVKDFWDWSVQAPLESILGDTGGLPGVVGTTALTPGPWGAPGERRIVHLSDGSSCTEQILAASPPHGFRYQVWNYSTAAARPIAYAVGEFRHVALDGERTEVVWTYAFRLRGDRFPGVLGPVGRWILKTAFLDRAYATLMRETLEAMKQGAEAALCSPRPRGR